jgi:predicted Zn-dependent protease
MLRSKDQVLSMLDAAITRSPGDATELVYIESREATARFAENIIHQNMDSTDARVIVRLVKDGRIAVSSTNDLTDSGLDRLLADAAQIASLLEPDSSFPGFATPAATQSVVAFHDSTANSSPESRAEAIAVIAKQAKSNGLDASGLYQTEAVSIAVVNSQGVRQWHSETRGEFSVSTSDDPTLGQGWSTGAGRDISRIDAVRLGGIAIDKAVRSRNPETIPAGDYTVVLEPAAVGQMLLFLGFLAFSGKSFAQGRGVLSGKIGEKVTGDNITITDDPYLTEYPGMPFDYEGTPKQRVVLIENGIARGVVHDRRSGIMATTESTGHALPPDNARGPYPKNLVMNAGSSSLEEMIASTERGILITHFWYLNYLNPMNAQLTGSTRDGTFLIENGKLTKPLKNMRATPAVLEVLSRVEMISKDRLVYPQYSAAMFVPALKIAGFPFVEDTES